MSWITKQQWHILMNINNLLLSGFGKTYFWMVLNNKMVEKQQFKGIEASKDAHLLSKIHLVLIIDEINMWTTKKPSQKNNSDIIVMRVSDWLKWLDLFKISSLMSQFSTNQRTLSVFCCFLFAVLDNCWSTTPTF